jgi:hypothetical protein
MGHPKTICIDFDGVIHDYRDGWQGGVIYGEVTPGFRQWCREMIEEADRRGVKLELCIYSSRSKEAELNAAMIRWVREQIPGIGFTFAFAKPAAWVTIDDRGITFNGSWDDPALRPAAIFDFKTWAQRG